MTMSNEEIVRDYLGAKNQIKQIGILAELNACRKSELAQILMDAGQLSARSVGQFKRKEEMAGNDNPSPLRGAPLTQGSHEKNEGAGEDEILRCAQNDKKGVQNDKKGVQNDKKGVQNDKKGVQKDKAPEDSGLMRDIVEDWLRLNFESYEAAVRLVDRYRAAQRILEGMK